MAGVWRIKISEIPFIPDEQLLVDFLVDFLEKTVDKGGICACRLLTTTSSSSLNNSEAKLSALVEIKSEELASDLYNLAKAGLLVFWSAPLTVQLLQNKDIPSNPKPVQNDRASTGPNLLQNSIASHSKSVEDIRSQPKSMEGCIAPEPKSMKEDITSGSKYKQACIHKQCCILTEQKDIISGTSTPQRDIVTSGLKSIENDIISGTKAPQKDIMMSGLKPMLNDFTSGIKAPQKDAQKDIIMSGSKSTQTLNLREPKPAPKDLMAGPKSMPKDSVSGPRSTQNYSNVVEPKPVQKDSIPLPRSRQNDITKGPKSTQMSSFEGLNLHMGCQTSENTLFVSCSRTGVKAEFDFVIKKISLYLKECSTEYGAILAVRNG